MPLPAGVRSLLPYVKCHRVTAGCGRQEAWIRAAMLGVAILKAAPLTFARLCMIGPQQAKGRQ
jgi:hypothetical protein